MADVYRAVEGGPPFSRPRRRPNPACPIGGGIEAALQPVFSSALKALERDLARTTLAAVLVAVKAGPTKIRTI